MLTPDVCVIGAGSAGLTVAAAARSFGHSVVLVERGRMGGDCLNYGCVPSKSLIAAARHAAAAGDGARFGIHAEPRIDFAAVADHVHDVIAAIAPHDSVERFERLGVTVLQASARFLDARTVEAGGETIRARRFVVATGSSPVVPPIPGLAEADPLTNESVFDLRALPRRLGIIGGGPIGAELAQAFARLGSEVTVIQSGRLLAKEDPDAVAVVREALLRDGVRLLEGEKVERVDGGVLHLSGGGTVEADRILVAIGRRANVAGLGLEAAGIEATDKGIVVDRGLKTTNRRVFAIGDVTGGLQFTHVAGHQASLAVRAIVFRLTVRYDPDIMPRATYTSPELAQVGLTEAEARQRDGRTTVSVAPLARNDRAQTAGETDGFLKLVITGGRLVGATIVSPHAGELAATYQLALAAKVKLSAIASFTPAYPTLAEAGKRAAVDHFAPAFQARWVQRLLSLLKRL
jgi:pyruvate/2-oxoglutarate dehydrogenase complex dihydrolipoamide dehydrogenase (E3) component